MISSKKEAVPNFYQFWVKLALMASLVVPNPAVPMPYTQSSVPSRQVPPSLGWEGPCFMVCIFGDARTDYAPEDEDRMEYSPSPWTPGTSRS